MKTFITKNSKNTDGPKIKAENYIEAKKFLKLINSNKDKIVYKITGEEIIINLQ